MSTLLTCRSASARRYARGLSADANSLLRMLALERCELSLMLVSDKAIRRLNRDFRAKDQPTDVLSFPQLDVQAPPPPDVRAGAKNAPPIALGDIVISIDTASRQACELGQPTAARMRTLLIHGLLHLLGYDHERSAAQARRMFKREHELAEFLNDAERPQPHPTRMNRSSGVIGAARANDPIRSRWSPAAMPEQSAKAAREPSQKRDSPVKAAPVTPR